MVKLGILGILKARIWIFDCSITKFGQNLSICTYILPNIFATIGENIISSGLADSIMYPDQFDDYVNSLNDEKVMITKWKDIDQSDFYVHEWAPPKKEKIAIIYAVGSIVPGKSNPGPRGSSRMGHETIGKAIESARKNEDIKAIVMRVDSPGGSVYASDQIW